MYISTRELWEQFVFIKNALENTVPKEKCLECLKPFKERIRSRHKLSECHSDPNEYPQWRTLYGKPDEYDRRFCKYVIPRAMTPKEIEKYIEDTWEHWYNPYDDGRDCTGVWFTSGISCFPIPACNKTIIYHWQNCDV